MTPTTGVQPRIAPVVEAVDIATLRTAIRSRSKLHLVYRAEDRGQTERTIWPVMLGYSDSHRILIAWCEMREGFRHFRTDRMVAAEVMDERIPETRHVLHRRWEAWRASELGEIR